MPVVACGRSPLLGESEGAWRSRPTSQGDPSRIPRAGGRTTSCSAAACRLLAAGRKPRGRHRLPENVGVEPRALRDLDPRQNLLACNLLSKPILWAVHRQIVCMLAAEALATRWTGVSQRSMTPSQGTASSSTPVLTALVCALAGMMSTSRFFAFSISTESARPERGRPSTRRTAPFRLRPRRLTRRLRGRRSDGRSPQRVRRCTWRRRPRPTRRPCRSRARRASGTCPQRPPRSRTARSARPP